MILRTLTIAMLLAATASCNDADFKSSNNEERPPLPVSVQCETDGTYNDENQIIPVPTDKETVKLEVTGEFCPQAPADLTVLFLIDFSLSMYNANADPVRGNDQLIDGTCGRLDAAKAITERIADSVKALKANVEVGVVAFSSAIDESISPKALADFKADLTPENFCRGSGKTNYHAAFEEAEEILTDTKGTKIVYFVTDGLPSMGGDAEDGLLPEHQEAAISAAKSLRKIDKLTMNTVYLGNEFEDVDVDPEELLAEITGDAERVKIVATADKLATQILELENPPVVLDTSSVTARFENGIEDPLPIKFISFEPSPTREEVWVFETEPFQPFAADEGQPELIIEGLDAEGETYRVVFTIIPDLSPSEDEE